MSLLNKITVLILTYNEAPNIGWTLTALSRISDLVILDSGHSLRAVVNGAVAALRGSIFRDDRKTLSRWFASQQQYAKLEADHLSRAASASLCQADKIRLMAFPAPILIFLCTLIAKCCILDGWAGWLYVLQRTLAIMIVLEVLDRRHAGGSEPAKPR